MKTIIFIVATAAITIGFFLFVFPAIRQSDKNRTTQPAVTLNQPTVTIRGKTFLVEIADTPPERAIGLSNRQDLPQDAGMLFVFENQGIQAFWMKNTLIPLDMIFIRNNTIVTIHRDVPVQAPETPDTQLPRYAPTDPVNFVLEINAGLSDTYGFAEGDTVEIKGL
mgnify:CR=1 FL=1